MKVNCSLSMLYILIILICLYNFSYSVTTEKDLAIFVATHIDFKPMVSNRVYKKVGDDKNSLKLKYDLDVYYADRNNELYQRRIGYGECAKFYYIYKNIKNLPKYIGTAHYRTFFPFLDDIPDMDEIFKDYDVILPLPISNKPCIKKNFEIYHILIMDELLEIIKDIFSTILSNST